MRNKWKVLVLSLLMAAVVLLEPASYVRADEASGESYERNSFPVLTSSEVKFEKKNFFNWFGIKDLPEENCIEEFILAHRKSKNVDYTLYYLVCDFELKTIREDETVTTSHYVYEIDLSEYENGFFDNIMVQFNLKEDYFEHVFSYFDIVKNAEGFQQKDINGKEKYFTYNTVISKADFNFVRKTDGKSGMGRRFTFIWDSNFWLQKCTKITFSWFDPGTEIEKEIESIENLNGVDGINNDYTVGLEYDDLSSFLLDLPAVAVRIVRGVIDFFIIDFPRLLNVVFPFIPFDIFSILGGILILSVLFALWKLIRG